MTTPHSTQSGTPDHNDAQVFLAFAAGGFLGMWLMKSLAIPQGLITTIMVAAVIGYAFSVYRFDRWKLRLDQAGDNAYYLGLIYTLLSMIFALIEIGNQVSSQGDEARSVAEAIIGDFGLAVGTTLAGIVCRVYLHQMRSDPGSVEEATRIELAIAAERMRSHINDLTTTFGSFFLTLQQQQEDYHREMRESQEKTRREYEESLTRSKEAAEKHFRESAEILSSAADSLQLVISECISSFKSVQTGWRKIEKASPEILQGLTTLAEAAKTSETRVLEFADGAREPVSQMTSVATSMQTLFQNLQSLQESVEAQADSYQNQLRATSDGAVSRLRELDDLIQKVIESSEGLAEAASRSAEHVLVSEGSAVKVLDSLIRVVDSVSQPSQSDK